MKRRTFEATVKGPAGDVIATATAYAWNSAIRASEALVRELARERSAAYMGNMPNVIGLELSERVYSRMWAGEDGRTVWAYVRELVS